MKKIPVFKDREIYEKCKFTIITKIIFQSEKEIVVEIEYLSKDSNWHSLLPEENYFKELEKDKDNERNKEILSSWAKYRKWQKRKRYNIEEFDRIFILE